MTPADTTRLRTTKVITVIVAAVLIVTIGAMLLLIVGRREGAPVRHRISHSPRAHELRVARDQLTAGTIDADEYERIIHALRR
jgi:uncharacterized membrane protein